MESSLLLLMVTVGSELGSGTVGCCCCLGSWSKTQTHRSLAVGEDRRVKPRRAEGTATFIFTLAQEGKPSLQLLWTQAPQSGKEQAR